VLALATSDPRFVPAQREDAARLAAARCRYADLIAACAYSGPATSEAERLTRVSQRVRATGVLETLQDLPAPRGGLLGAAFDGGPLTGRGELPPAPYEFAARDGAVATLLLRHGGLGLPTPDSHDVVGVRPGVSRAWWASPKGSLDGRGRPAWNGEDRNAAPREDAIPLHLRDRLEARGNLVHARTFKSTALGTEVLPAPPTSAADATAEGMSAFLRGVGEFVQSVAAGGGRPTTAEKVTYQLNTWEGFLRMHGFSLMNFTNRGLPEEVRCCCGGGGGCGLCFPRARVLLALVPDAR
jgi:hypothetical protein